MVLDVLVPICTRMRSDGMLQSWVASACWPGLTMAWTNSMTCAQKLGVSETQGDLRKIPISRPVVVRRPQKAPPIYRNSHMVLLKISSKPALHQPQIP